jgi:dolichol-phosphate mannosyltransferase
VLAIDDGSDDGTGTEIKALLTKYPSLYLRHGRRGGQSDALRTGVLAAHFPVIATMDGDGQNDPADIMRLAGRLGSQGLEPAVAAGIRAGRKGPGSRKAASRFANWIGDKVLADGCPTPAAGSSSIGVTPISSSPTSPACTAICRLCSSLMAMKSPMRR